MVSSWGTVKRESSVGQPDGRFHPFSTNTDSAALKASFEKNPSLILETEAVNLSHNCRRCWIVPACWFRYGHVDSLNIWFKWYALKWKILIAFNSFSNLRHLILLTENFRISDWWCTETRIFCGKNSEIPRWNNRKSAVFRSIWKNGDFCCFRKSRKS